MQKMFKWFDDDSKIANCRKYTEEEKSRFYEKNARQWNKLTGYSDTRDQLARGGYAKGCKAGGVLRSCRWRSCGLDCCRISRSCMKKIQ